MADLEDLANRSLDLRPATETADLDLARAEFVEDRQPPTDGFGPDLAPFGSASVDLEEVSSTVDDLVGAVDRVVA